MPGQILLDTVGMPQTAAHTDMGDFMGTYKNASAGRFQRTMVFLLGAAASGVLAVVALSSAGAANASCASFSGINSGTGVGKCETTTIGDTAIGIGNTDLVQAIGGFNTAIAIGDGTSAITRPNTPGDSNVGNLAIAMGNSSNAVSTGFGNSAMVIGNNSGAGAGGVLNRALVIGNDSNTINGRFGALAVGTLSRATVLGDHSTAFAGTGSSGNLASLGTLNSALTIGNYSNSAAHGTLQLGAALGSNKNADNGINNK
jgi:hypothetical protein